MRQLVGRVVRLRRLLIVRFVASETLRGGVIELPVHVALSTRGVHMCARQRKIGSRVIKDCGLPSCGRMTLSAGMIEVARDVIRVLHSFEVRLMTGEALLRRSGILPIDVTGCAAHIDVRSSQREVREIVIEFCRRPSGRRMTLRASVRQLQLSMIRIIRIVVIGLVARPTFLRRAIELSVRVTLRTG